MRKKIIAGNWKMYKTPQESLEFLNAFLPQVHDHERNEIVLFPTITSLAAVIDRVRNTRIHAGAQTMHWLNEGAYTAQTSPIMLTSIGATHVLLGHSECRQYANENSEHINLKLKAAIAHNLKPVLCVGEQIADRQSGFTRDIIMAQMGAALSNIPVENAKHIVIAYEPVWAIGTGATASPEMANEVHRIIREELAHIFNQEVALKTRILYGGSVKPENSESLLTQPDIDGLLIGGASLDPVSFAKIIHTKY